MNKKLIILIFIVLALILLTFIIIFKHNHKHSLKYNDNWIIGRNITEIEKRYGDTIEFSERERAYYLYKDTIGPMANGQEMYYIMRLNHEYIVKEVYIAGPPGG